VAAVLLAAGQRRCRPHGRTRLRSGEPGAAAGAGPAVALQEPSAAQGSLPAGELPESAVVASATPRSTPEGDGSESLSLEGDVQALLGMLLGNPLNALLLCVPLGLVSESQGWGDVATFGLNFLAIVPLANLLGYATEELAIAVGPSFGGLLNATLGNAVEMILTVFALREGLVEVVKGSLVGSVLSNLLLVLGMSFFFGGLNYKEQVFSADSARTQASLLLLAVLALVLPTLVASQASGPIPATLLVSRGCAVVLALLYGLYLYFQFVSHKDEFEAEEGEEEEEEAELSPGGATAVLAAATLVIAACSESLTGSVGGMTKDLGISESFVGVVLLPIVGNAAEHLTAVSVAAKNKMDLALGVALGSSTQIALFVVPFSVLIGWYVGVPMDLNFHVLPASVLLLTALIVSSTIADGRSNWLEGAMLVAAYVLIGIAFWYS